MTETAPDVELLPLDACWALLRAAEVGRLAVLVDGCSEIFPVTFVVDAATVVFRTAPGTKVAGALAGPPVAFEVDGLDRRRGSAWSVVLKGRVRRIVGTEELLGTLGLPLAPLHAGPKPLFLRLEPDQVTGRRFPLADPQVWAEPLAGGRPAEPE